MMGVVSVGLSACRLHEYVVRGLPPILQAASNGDAAGCLKTHTYVSMDTPTFRCGPQVLLCPLTQLLPYSRTTLQVVIKGQLYHLIRIIGNPKRSQVPNT